MSIQLCCFCPFWRLHLWAKQLPGLFKIILKTSSEHNCFSHLSRWCHMLPWSWNALKGSCCQTGEASRMSPSTIPSRSHTSERTLPQTKPSQTLISSRCHYCFHCVNILPLSPALDGYATARMDRKLKLIWGYYLSTYSPGASLVNCYIQSELFALFLLHL